MKVAPEAGIDLLSDFIRADMRGHIGTDPWWWRCRCRRGGLRLLNDYIQSRAGRRKRTSPFAPARQRAVYAGHKATHYPHVNLLTFQPARAARRGLVAELVLDQVHALQLHASLRRLLGRGRRR